MVAGCGYKQSPSWTYPPTTAGGGAAAPAPAAARRRRPRWGGGRDAAIEAFDLGFTLSTLEVPAAGRYEVTSNTGAAPHDMTFPTGETGAAQPGETVSLEVDIPAGGASSCARSWAMPTPA